MDGSKNPTDSTHPSIHRSIGRAPLRWTSHRHSYSSVQKKKRKTCHVDKYIYIMSEWYDKWLILIISINDVRSKGWRRMRLMRKFMSQQGHIARTCLNTIEFGWFRWFESECGVAHCSMNDALKSKLNDSKHSHLQNKKSRNKASTCYFQMLHLSFHRLPLMHNDVCTTAQDHAKTAFLTHHRRTRNQRSKVLPIHMLDVRATGLFSSVLQFLSSHFLSILQFLSSQFLNSGHPNLDY